MMLQSQKDAWMDIVLYFLVPGLKTYKSCTLCFCEISLVMHSVHMFERGSASGCILSGNTHQINPLLNLYNGCPVILNFNIDVKYGKANGCYCTTKSNVLPKKMHEWLLYYRFVLCELYDCLISRKQFINGGLLVRGANMPNGGRT
jgi:hypothetical protein